MASYKSTKVWSMTTKTPIDVARETLKQLSARKLLPTPENFERVYNELTGTPVERENKLALQLMRALETLPTATVTARATFSRLRRVMEEERWEQVPQLAIEFIRHAETQAALTESWGTLLANLIRAWEMRQPDLTQTYKQTALERVLINYGDRPEELNRKLAALVENWLTPSRARVASEDGEAPLPDVTQDIPAPPLGSMQAWQTWQRLLTLSLKHGLEPRLELYPDLVQALEALIREVSGLKDEAALTTFLARLRAFMIRLELQTQQEERLVHGLVGLLHLLLENIAEINRSDSYLVGQVASLQEVLGQRPLSMQHIYQLETTLKEVIRKQGQLKSSLDEAASSLRALLDRFITQLAAMTDSTDEFHTKINGHSEKLRSAHDIEEVKDIISSLVEDTSEMQVDLSRSRDELITAREQVEAAEHRIRELESALEAASAKVKEDQLTGAYNRRGLAEHFQREISRAERSNNPLSVALLDVDNFKQLNDRYGHLTGDDALKYLVDVIRHFVRPSDVVARFGGEEFVVLMPETSIEEAMQTVQRLQRELTKTFFLANNDRLVITFSAGVACWHLGEQDADVIERADRAMYQAKLSGKNRVFSAENLDLYDTMPLAD